MSSRLSSLGEAETLRRLVRNLREGIYVTDRVGRVLDANPAFLGMFGVSSLEELHARKVGELLVDPARREAELEILAPRRSDPGLRVRDPPHGRRDPHGHRLGDVRERPRDGRRLLPRHPDRHHGAKASRAAPPRPEPARPAHGLLQPAVPERVRAPAARREPFGVLRRPGAASWSTSTTSSSTTTNSVTRPATPS